MVKKSKAKGRRLKVGDRVAVYGGVELETAPKLTMTRKLGTVVGFFLNYVRVRLDIAPSGCLVGGVISHLCFHPKQIRRLRRKAA